MAPNYGRGVTGPYLLTSRNAKIAFRPLQLLFITGAVPIKRLNLRILPISLIDSEIIQLVIRHLCSIPKTNYAPHTLPAVRARQIHRNATNNVKHKRPHVAPKCVSSLECQYRDRQCRYRHYSPMFYFRFFVLLHLWSVYI